MKIEELITVKDLTDLFTLDGGPIGIVLDVKKEPELAKMNAIINVFVDDKSMADGMFRMLFYIAYHIREKRNAPKIEIALS